MVKLVESNDNNYEKSHNISLTGKELAFLTIAMGMVTEDAIIEEIKRDLNTNKSPLSEETLNKLRTDVEDAEYVYDDVASICEKLL